MKKLKCSQNLPNPKVSLENGAVVGSVFGTTHLRQAARRTALQTCVRFKVVTLLWLNVVSRSLISARDCEVFSHVLGRSQQWDWQGPIPFPVAALCSLLSSQPLCRQGLQALVGDRLCVLLPHENSHVSLFCILKMFYILTVAPL